MEITLTTTGEGLLKAELARHPEQSPAEIIEQALAERIEREGILEPQVRNAEAKKQTPEEFEKWLDAYTQFSE